MRYSLLLSLTLLFSCSKIHELKLKNGLYYFEDISSEIKEVKHIKWDVGREKENLVSMGMRISTSIPKIDDDAKETLYQTHKIDSWVFQLSKIDKGRKDPVGLTYFHFSNLSRSTKNFPLNIYYHAASISNKFRAFRCPAFDHRKLISDIELKKPQKKLANVFARLSGKVANKVERIGFTPRVFSAGRKMQGRYIMEYALYNSQTKERFSNWHDSLGVIEVRRETTVSIPSCIGVKEEIRALPESRELNIKDFEIK